MKANLFLRNDTIFGVCEALGEDFGFNPTLLRIALILPLFWFPLEVAITYAGLGLVVLASRLMFKERAVPAAEAAPQTGAQLVGAEAANSEVGLSDAA
ncbi:PspC domain-containing protein [Sphingomicrobium astaxanthinifaciens]|uniref:PspC domain-containing protein n=1 Tax=Sphingomicrobium astaxanthinifaciens TaxID=1227949 RepID=UPI001FCB1BAC|nr:PspC domain-containing protein [Sphingomicrobium astaxanthinifaciens]MCJ7422321.1 PspC domain-containing protein [Sphingomicrobium astaxanthinifaciens]